MNKKLKKNGGFTLVEMLIVVAIIAILIAISIPLVNSALEKSRHAVDQANERDAIALATIKYLTDEDEPTGTFAYKVDDDSHQGKLVASDGDAVEAQCQCDETGHKGLNLYVKVDTDGNATTGWGASADDAFEETPVESPSESD